MDLSDASKVAPLAPATLTAIIEAHDVRLSWPATGEDVTRYQCLRRGATASRWEPIAQASAGDRTCLDKSPAAGSYVYGVQAVSNYGTASTITESPPLTVPTS
jgi:hypothetical protein